VVSAIVDGVTVPERLLEDAQGHSRRPLRVSLGTPSSPPRWLLSSVVVLAYQAAVATPAKSAISPL
jgi:hypothetical protein